MDARPILVLVDGMRTRDLLEEVGAVVHLSDVELVLVYVVGPAPRSSLDMVSHRPGGPRLPPHRERSISGAERGRAIEALEEAERLARSSGGSVRTLLVEGDVGHVMVELAERERAKAVVLRAAPQGIGPAARHVVEHGRCSVILVRGGH